MEISRPDYKRIYSDMLRLKYPEKANDCKSILSGQQLSALEVIQINEIIFPQKKTRGIRFNQAYRAYSKEEIMKILDYQKKHYLNNSQLAIHFGLSRNSITKWKKNYV